MASLGSPARSGAGLSYLAYAGRDFSGIIIAAFVFMLSWVLS